MRCTIRTKFTHFFFLALVLVGPRIAFGESKHGISPVYNWTYINSSAGHKYHFHSPGVNYSFYRGADFGFLGSGSIILPLGAHQDGEFFSTPDYYARVFGFDLLLGLAGNVKITEEFGVITGGGVHMNGLLLSGNTHHSFYSLTAGLGASALVYYALSPTLFVGTILSSSVDMIEFVYAKDALHIALSHNIGVIVGIYFL